MKLFALLFSIAALAFSIVVSLKVKRNLSASIHDSIKEAPHTENIPFTFTKDRISYTGTGGSFAIKYDTIIPDPKYKIRDTVSSYKPGFTYYERGEKITLLKWVKVDDHWAGGPLYRWRIKIQVGNVNAKAWTDDCWIDLYTGKAWYDKDNLRIVKY